MDKPLKWFTPSGKEIPQEELEKAMRFLLETPEPKPSMREFEDVLAEIYIHENIDPSPEWINFGGENEKGEIRQFKEKKKKAEKILKEDQLKAKGPIVDSSQAQFLDARKAISFINELKKQTSSNRVIVVIDYLQVWPLSPHLRSLSELEVDKWRIGEIKKTWIRHSIHYFNPLRRPRIFY